MRNKVKESRRKLIRLQTWDYKADGYYFITIKTFKGIPWFGHIHDGEMFTNDIGKIIHEEWFRSEKIRTQVELDEFIVMPNHIHGIIVIKNHTTNPVGTHRVCPPTPNNKFGPQSQNIASIIRGFKAACTKQIRELGYKEFQWQSRFHDRIIRDNRELETKRIYIKNNPINYKKHGTP